MYGVLTLGFLIPVEMSKGVDLGLSFKEEKA